MPAVCMEVTDRYIGRWDLWLLRKQSVIDRVTEEVQKKVCRNSGYIVYWQNDTWEDAIEKKTRSRLD